MAIKTMTDIVNVRIMFAADSESAPPARRRV
jgi:hypothetical protein